MKGIFHSSSLLLIIIPILLGGFTHLWNPIGFPPGPINDEGIYLRRAMNIVEGSGPQESSPLYYDHPYFLQLFVAAIFMIIGYPDSLHPTIGDVYSIEMLYLVPRVLMGILAVVDIFLIYKIAEHRYNSRNVAFVASVLFAVMPITFPIRWVLLEPVQLPFLLLSILLAVYKKQQEKEEGHHLYKKGKPSLIVILISGIFLGLVIFTKITSFTMIPLIAFLVFTNNNNNKSWKVLGLWFIPVILIPLIWPTYAAFLGQFGLWLDGVYLQTQRGNNTFFNSIKYNYNIDPVFVTLGIVAVAFVVIIKKDMLILLWVLPFIIFLYIVGFVSIWHFIPVLPALCIAAARLIIDVPNKIAKGKTIERKILPFIVISAIGIFGFTNTATMILMGNNSSYFKCLAFLSQYLEQEINSNNKGYNVSRITVISNPFYLWIPQHVFNLDHNYIGYYDSNMPVKTKKVLSVLDKGFLQGLKNNQAGMQIQKINRNSHLYNISGIATFESQDQRNSNHVSIYLYELN
jgi:hypothetical protein